jgi:lipopolysaccharide export LptBFGC system permease protein LptF
MLIKSINIYLAKNFLRRFIQLTCAFSLLIFLINFIEIFNRTSANKVDLNVKLVMAFLNVPQFINEISSSLILISAIICYFSLSNRSEITIIRNSGLSLWHIAKPISLSALFIGIFWITVFQPLSIKTSKLLENLELINFSDQIKSQTKINSNLNSSNQIWLRQENLEISGEEIIINGYAIDSQNLKFANVSLWFFDNNGVFYKRIDSEEMSFINNSLILKNNTVNEQSEIFNNETTIFWRIFRTSYFSKNTTDWTTELDRKSVV